MARSAPAPHIPTRNGVGPSCVALPAGPWPLLLDFLAARFPSVARSEWVQRMASGALLDEAARPITGDQPYRPGARLYYWRSLATEPVIPYEEQVLFQDEFLVVADKPHFLPVTPIGRYVQQSLLVRLKRKLGIDTLSPLHRIDRETAGLVLFAIQPQTRNAYSALFRERAVAKSYQAIAPRPPAGLVFPLVYQSRLVEDSLFFRMCQVPGPANSETHIEVLEVRGELARYQLTPITGKRHQLRVHMNALGLPLVGDQFYPQVLRGPDGAEDFAQPLMLLAQSLAFTDPVTGEARCFKSALSLGWETRGNRSLNDPQSTPPARRSA